MGADHPDPVCRVVLVVSIRKNLIALVRIRARAQIVRLANTAMVATVDVQIVNMENIDLKVKTSVNYVRLESMHRPRLLMWTNVKIVQPVKHPMTIDQIALNAQWENI